MAQSFKVVAIVTIRNAYHLIIIKAEKLPSIIE